MQGLLLSGLLLREHRQKDEENHKDVCYFLNLTIKCYATREVGCLHCNLPLEMPGKFVDIQRKFANAHDPDSPDEVPEQVPERVDS